VCSSDLLDWHLTALEPGGDFPVTAAGLLSLMAAPCGAALSGSPATADTLTLATGSFRFL